MTACSDCGDTLAQPPRPPAPFGGAELPMDELVERIARRVVALLAAGVPAAGELVDAATLARRLGLSTSYVYRHAEELGARAVGGERGRGRPLRFDPVVAVERATGREASDGSHVHERTAKQRRSRRRAAPPNGSGPDPLPIARPEVPR